MGETQVRQLRKNTMMAHLLDALAEGEDIGHFGRLVFAMVTQYFFSEDEFVEWLQKDPDIDEDHARALWQQVRDKEYSPPSRQKVLQYQERQDFPICPDPDDPDACNVYRDLQFPEHVYHHIEDYHLHKIHNDEE
jgi:DNA primase large subunit